MVDWDSLDDATRRFHSDLFDFPTVAVYNYEDGYDPATGDTGYTEVHAGDVEMELTAPTTPRLITDPDGQETQVDVMGFVRDDVNIEFTPVGTDNTRPTQVEHDGSRYLLADAFDEGNGIRRLLLIEV